MRPYKTDSKAQRPRAPLAPSLPLSCQKIRRQGVAVVRQEGFRVELDPVEGKMSVLQAHDDAVLGPGGDFQVRGVGLGHEGVVAGGAERAKAGP